MFLSAAVSPSLTGTDAFQPCQAARRSSVRRRLRAGLQMKLYNGWRRYVCVCGCIFFTYSILIYSCLFTYSIPTLIVSSFASPSLIPISHVTFLCPTSPQVKLEAFKDEFLQMNMTGSKLLVSGENSITTKLPVSLTSPTHPPSARVHMHTHQVGLVRIPLGLVGPWGDI